MCVCGGGVSIPSIIMFVSYSHPVRAKHWVSGSLVLHIPYPRGKMHASRVRDFPVRGGGSQGLTVATGCPQGPLCSIQPPAFKSWAPCLSGTEEIGGCRELQLQPARTEVACTQAPHCARLSIQLRNRQGSCPKSATPSLCYLGKPFTF